MTPDVEPSMWKDILYAAGSAAVVVIPALLYFMRRVGRWESNVILLMGERGQARPFCIVQENRLMEKSKEAARETVTAALKDLIIANNNQLASIKTSLALLEQSSGRIQEDITEIFERLNRRHDEPLYTESTYSRRKTDVAL